MDKLGQEWVSAAVDGETNTQTMAELAAETKLHQKWRNYHLIGDTLRDELPTNIDLNLSSNIAAALEKESPITSSFSLNDEQHSDQNVSQTSKITPFLKQFGQYAIAASVAVFAVIGVQSYNQSSDNTDISPLPVLDTRPLVGTVSPVSLQTAPIQQYRNTNEEQKIQAQRLQLNAYIQDHMLQQRLNSNLILNENIEKAVTNGQ